MPYTIIQQDITRLKVDAIVNAANTSLQMGSGVCGAIFNAAGADRLQNACDRIAPIKTGEAVITPGFALPAKYIIHTAGPVFCNGNQGEITALRACYINSLELAAKYNCESIAFPLISSGIYGFPKAEALRVAASAIQDFLADHDIDITLAMFDKGSFIISDSVLDGAKDYIDKHYVCEGKDKYHRQFQQAEIEEIKEIRSICASIPVPMLTERTAGIENLLGNLDEPFSEMLLQLINAKGKTDVEVYKRANLDRKLFSKIRSNKDYTPRKRTVIALAIALELSLNETDEFLGRAGYAFSSSRIFDVIVEYFIVNQKYNIFEINEVLFSYNQPLLGG